jgi:hypothetical protein
VPPPPSFRARLLVAVAVLAALALTGVAAGCSDDDEATTSSATTSAPIADEGATTTTTSRLPEPVPETPPPDDAEPSTGPEEAPPPTGPPATVVAPDVLGVPGEFGIAYPAGTTCPPVEALLASAALTSGAWSEVTGSGGIWLAVDPGSTSADVLFGPPAAEPRLVTIRAGAVASSGPPSPAQSPALTPEESYAITEVAPGGTLTSCIEGPVVV